MNNALFNEPYCVEISTKQYYPMPKNSCQAVNSVTNFLVLPTISSNTYEVPMTAFMNAAQMTPIDKTKFIILLPESDKNNAKDKTKRERKVLNLLLDHADVNEIAAYLKVDKNPKKACRALIKLAKQLKNMGLENEQYLVLEHIRELMKTKETEASEAVNPYADFQTKKIEGQKKLMEHMKENFEAYDKDGNGFISLDEIKAAQSNDFEGMSDLSEEAKEHLAVVANKFNELHFANLDSGSGAWHGFSTNDINNLGDRLSRKESLEEIARNLRKQIIRDRNLKDDLGFEAHHAFHQANALLNPDQYDTSYSQYHYKGRQKNTFRPAF